MGCSFASPLPTLPDRLSHDQAFPRAGEFLVTRLQTPKHPTMSSAKKTVPPGTLLGFGNPLLDISATVDQAFYKKYDLKPASACLAEAKHEGIYTDLIENHKDVQYVAGGATQNACRIAQTLLGASSPGACRFIGGVGNDEYAERLRQANKAVHMETLYHVDETVPTGTCAVAVLDHECVPQ